MTRKEAIEILGDIPGLGDRYDDDDLEQATKLGIKGMKELEAYKKRGTN